MGDVITVNFERPRNRWDAYPAEQLLNLPEIELTDSPEADVGIATLRVPKYGRVKIAFDPSDGWQYCPEPNASLFVLKANNPYERPDARAYTYPPTEFRDVKFRPWRERRIDIFFWGAVNARKPPADHIRVRACARLKREFGELFTCGLFSRPGRGPRCDQIPSNLLRQPLPLNKYYDLLADTKICVDLHNEHGWRNCCRRQSEGHMFGCLVVTYPKSCVERPDYFRHNAAAYWGDLDDLCAVVDWFLRDGEHAESVAHKGYELFRSSYLNEGAELLRDIKRLLNGEAT